MTGKELAKAFGDAVNSSNFDKDEFIQEFAREHRTLQQSMFGAMLGVVKFVGSSEYRTDARNEQSHKVAKQILDGYREEVVKEFMSQGDSEERARKHSKMFVDRIDCLGFI